MALNLTFYENRDDNRALQLKEDGANLTVGAYQDFTKIILECRSAGIIIALDSTIANHKILIDAANQQLILELGLVTDLPVGFYSCRVIGITAADPSGVVYADHTDFTITKLP